MTELSVPAITECAGAVGIADAENAGIAANTQAATLINIQRYICSLSFCSRSSGGDTHDSGAVSMIVRSSPVPLTRPSRAMDTIVGQFCRKNVVAS